jgi:two-component system OmpR family response regulator
MTRVLIVEDDPAMGALVAGGLRDDGYEVSLRTTGSDGLTRFVEGGIDVLVVDVMLPGMDGFELCRHVRRSGSTVPIILITARDAVEDRIRGLDSGADDYVIKPFHFGELSARIRAQVRRQEATPHPVVELGSLRLDSLTVRATVGGRSFSLSNKEFGLLRLLVLRRDSVVSRTEILEDVWGSAVNFDTTIVDQYVSYVRRKLDTMDLDLRIVTVRGTGYRLEGSGLAR